MIKIGNESAMFYTMNQTLVDQSRILKKRREESAAITIVSKY